MHKILIYFYFFEFFLATPTPRPSPTSKYLKLIQIIGQAEKRIMPLTLHEIKVLEINATKITRI